MTDNPETIIAEMASEIFNTAVGADKWDNEFYADERKGVFVSARACWAVIERRCAAAAKAAEAAGPAAPGRERRCFPSELTPELEWILGRPNFACGPIAHAFQLDGKPIPKKAEAEQAFVIHWMVNLLLEHGETWREEAAKELDAMAERRLSRQPKEPPPS